MNRINLRQQMGIITGIIAVISVIIALLVIAPTVRQILSLEKSINETQKFLEQQYEKTQRMRRSVHNLDATIERTEKFNQSVVQDGDELQIITQLEKLAFENNIDQVLKVERVDPKEVKGATPNIEKIPVLLRKKPYYIFSFSNTGNFEDHLRYIKDVEQLPYFLNINPIKFNKKDNSDSISVRFDAKIYITEK